VELFHVSWQHRVIETKHLYIIVFSSNVTKLPKTYHVIKPYEHNNGENAYVCACMHAHVCIFMCKCVHVEACGRERQGSKTIQEHDK